MRETKPKPEAYLEPSGTSMMEFFWEIADG